MNRHVYLEQNSESKGQAVFELSRSIMRRFFDDSLMIHLEQHTPRANVKPCPALIDLDICSAIR